MKTALRFLVLSNLRAEIKFGGFHDKEKNTKHWVVLKSFLPFIFL